MWIQRRSHYVLVAEKQPVVPALHSHHVVQLSLGLHGLTRALVAGQALHGVAGVLIGPNVPHSTAGDVLHVFVDPLDALGRRLRGMLGAQPFLALDAALTDHIWRAARFRCRASTSHDAAAMLSAAAMLDSDAPLHALFDALALAHPDAGLAPLDPRIERVIASLRTQLDSRVSLTELAAEAGLSASRLTHLFTREVGMPIKQYVVWLRMVAVLEGSIDGTQLGTLAHAAGFPDQAALCRSYRRTWGRTPTSFLRARGHVGGSGARKAHSADVAARIKSHPARPAIRRPASDAVSSARKEPDAQPSHAWPAARSKPVPQRLR